MSMYCFKNLVSQEDGHGERMKKNKNKGFEPSGTVFPNHIHLTSINFAIELGSFDVPMRKLLDYGLNCMAAMKKLEEEK